MNVPVINLVTNEIFCSDQPEPSNDCWAVEAEENQKKGDN